MATVQILWILSGMLILEESQYYTWAKMGGILASFVVSCVGVAILMMKINKQNKTRWVENASQVESACEEAEEKNSDDSSPKNHH